MWANCPHQWRLRYVDGHKHDTPGIALSFGTAMHDTIQKWLTILYNESPLKANTFDMHEFLKERLTELVKRDLLPEDGEALTTLDEVSEHYANGCDILDHVRKHAKDWFPKSHTLIGVEVPLELEVAPSVTFKAYLDIVLYRKSAKIVYIYDLKTSKRGWWPAQKKDPKKTDQLLLYKRYYSEKFGVPMDNVKVEFIILKRQLSENEYDNKRVVGFEPANGTPSMKKADERFQKFLSVFNEQGEPDISKLIATPSDSACKYCPFNNNVDLCPYSSKLPTSQRKLPIRGNNV
jgi:PD-(D/E)XK nuclease superfamily